MTWLLLIESVRPNMSDQISESGACNICYLDGKADGGRSVLMGNLDIVFLVTMLLHF